MTPSVPTRRSSDLDYRRLESDYGYGFDFSATGLDAFDPVYGTMPDAAPSFTGTTLQETGQVGLYVQDQITAGQWLVTIGGRQDRSEEHTSELQSLMRISYAVVCLKNK